MSRFERTWAQRLEDADQAGYVRGVEFGRTVGPRRQRAVLLAFLGGLVVGLLPYLVR